MLVITRLPLATASDERSGLPLLGYVVERAADPQLVRMVAVESERTLAFDGVHQLLVPFLPATDRLPEPQRRALGVALGLVSGPPANPFLVGLAAPTLLADAAEVRPVSAGPAADSGSRWKRPRSVRRATVGNQSGPHLVRRGTSSVNRIRNTGKRSRCPGGSPPAASVRVRRSTLGRSFRQASMRRQPDAGLPGRRGKRRGWPSDGTTRPGAAGCGIEKAGWGR
jgi:hypothetical protein